MNTTEIRRDRRRKTMAIGAAAVALGLGVTGTLAAWTDTEWVFGGDGAGGPGIGTSTFEIQQNTTSAFDAAGWTDEETNPGGEITFAPAALALTPGDTSYAAVALRSAPTSIAGDVTLQPAIPAAGVTTDDADGLLFAALDVQVATNATPFTCDAGAFADGATPEVIATGPLAAAGASDAQALTAAAGSTQYYCFAVSLPAGFTPAAGQTADDYMGRSVAPAWQFQAESE